MSQQEFDNYLALLGRLLRFDAKQREAVAQEFRAHLEDRLDELLARGYDRDRAVQLAIEEFGDAAGLAAELANISRGRRRRWIMRCTTATVGGLAAVVLLTLALWPDNGSVPAPPRLTAQEEKQPDGGRAKREEQKESKQKRAVEPVDGGPPTVQEVLARPVTVEFIDTPLADVLSFLSDTAKVQFYVKSKRLEESGVALDIPITLRLTDVRLGTVLDLLLEQIDLTYVDRDELLIITSRDDAEATMEVRVYDCRDLLAIKSSGNSTLRSAPGGGGFFSVPNAPVSRRKPATVAASPSILAQFGGAAPADSPGGDKPKASTAAAGSDTAGGGFGGGGGMGMGLAPVVGKASSDVQSDALILLLATTVEPDSWNEAGGPGSLAMYNGLLVVRQSAQTHAKVERVLNMLRESAGLDPKSIRVTK